MGASFGFTHLFIAYSIPTSLPFTFSLGDVSSAISSDVSAAASTATASATAGIGAWLKKFAFRAAGEEGLAENVENEDGQPFGVDALHAASDLKRRQQVRYRQGYKVVHCVDTSGEVFAILLNCFYLAPLTLLFVQFFIKSYSRRSNAGEKAKTAEKEKHVIEESSKDAAKGVERKLQEALEE